MAAAKSAAWIVVRIFQASEIEERLTGPIHLAKLNPCQRDCAMALHVMQISESPPLVGSRVSQGH